MFLSIFPGTGVTKKDSETVNGEKTVFSIFTV